MLRIACFALLLCLAIPHVARAELVDLKIHRSEPFAEGYSFGDTGPYEKLIGIATFLVDPKHKRNSLVVDLDKTPLNAAGKVEFRSDVCILVPKDRSKANGAILYDVNNRGNKLALGMFNDGNGSNDPGTLAHAGNGFLFRHGFTVVWCGWIGELLPGNGRMLMQAPIARDGDNPIRGIVRYEMGTDSRVDAMPLSRRDGHGSYPLTSDGEANGKLTVRTHEGDVRKEVARDQWSIERLEIPVVKDSVPGTLPQIKLKLKGGFEPGHIYELIAEAEGPIVQGLGFVAVRDLVSFLKYDVRKINPLSNDGNSVITRAHGFGVSQSGRFLRHFLYQEFNIDEQNRKVFDGLMPHVAGGGIGSFNQRFAQPTRHNAQHEEHAYPADVFPFAYGLDHDWFWADATRKEKLIRNEKPDGLLHRWAREDEKFAPKVMHTQSSAEYWHRSGSLVHTDTLGTKDAIIPENVRIYSFGGTQHGPAGFPPTKGIGDNLANPGDYRPFLRALLIALDQWIVADKAPPVSVYPTIRAKLLVPPTRADVNFPMIPGVRFPTVIMEPGHYDRSKEPPVLKGRYRVLVPKCGDQGNELGMLLPPEVTVPVATFTGWNIRRKEFGADAQLLSLTGSYIPFPRTEAEREKTGDPRFSLEQRYDSFEIYEEQFQQIVREHIEKRYLLEEDRARLRERITRVKELFEKK